MMTNNNTIDNPLHIYHTKRWCKFTEEAFKVNINTLAIETTDNKMQLLLPLKDNSIVLPPLWAYNIPVFSKQPTIKEQLFFANELKNFLNKYDSFIIDYPVNIHPYQLARYAHPYYEFVLNLPYIPSNNMKEAYRKAKKNGFEIITKISQDELIKVYEKLAITYKTKKKKIPYTIDAFLSLTNQPFIRNFLMHYKKDIAFASVGIYKNKSYGIINIGNNNDILKMHIFNKLSESHIDQFFFVGANTPGIIEHKARFRPNTITLIRIHKYGFKDRLKVFIKGVL